MMAGSGPEISHNLDPEDENVCVGDFNCQSEASSTFIVNNNEMELVMDGLKDTLRYMKYREALRLYYGAFSNYSFVYSISLVTFFLLFVISSTQISGQFGPVKQQAPNHNFLSDPNNVVHICVYGCYAFSVVSLWISHHPLTFVRTTRLSKIFIAIYLIGIPIVMLYNLNENIKSHIYNEPIYNLRSYTIYSECYFDTAILFFYSIFLFITNVIALFYRFIYRYLILYWINQDIECYRITYKQKISVTVPKVMAFRHLITRGMPKSSGNKSTGLSLILQHIDNLPWYKEILPALLFNVGRVAKTNHPCRYVGQVDAFNRPHGFGFWKSTSFYGEVLVGFWENGKPIGTFKAREMGTGSGFSNILIGWAKCDFDPKYMKIGVASAECCVSGAFFRTFPRVLTYEAESLPIGNINYDVIHKTLEIPESYQLDENNQLIFGKKPKFQTLNGVALALSHVSNDLNKINYSMKCAANDSENFPNIIIDNSEPIKSYINNDNVNYINESSQPKLNNLVTSKKSINPIHYLRYYKHASKNNFEYKFSCATSLDAVLSSMCPHSPIFVTNTFNSITVSTNAYGIDIHGHTSNCTNFKDSVTIRIDCEETLSAEGWIPSEMIGIVEVWIFIHGFNTSCTDSVVLMGQMSAFGNFPPYIKPLIFSWPSENSLFKFFKARDNASNEVVHCHFKSFIEALFENGIRNLHIMTHSMGARMFITSFSKIKHMFNKHDSSNASKINLLTITLISPEYDLETFILKDFAVLRKYCSIISIFSDLRDKALISCEKLTKGKALGRRVFDVYSTKDIESISSDSSDSDSLKCSESTDARYYIPNDTEIKPLQSKKMGFLEKHSATIADMKLPKHLNKKMSVNIDVNADGRGKRRKKGNFKHSNTLSNFEIDCQDADKKNWLDVDVIDTTWLGSNINNIRHTFWFLNREIIEDIRELIVYRKRACQRTGRLDRREGNVWVYRVAPQDVKSVFT